MYELNNKEKKALKDIKRMIWLFFVCMLFMMVISSYYETKYYADQEAAREQEWSDICNSELGELIDNNYVIHSTERTKIESIKYNTDKTSDTYDIWIESDGMIKLESYSPNRVIIHKTTGSTSYISYSEAYSNNNYGINSFTMIELYLCPSDVTKLTQE